MKSSQFQAWAIIEVWLESYDIDNCCVTDREAKTTRVSLIPPPLLGGKLNGSFKCGFCESRVCRVAYVVFTLSLFSKRLENPSMLMVLFLGISYQYCCLRLPGLLDITAQLIEIQAESCCYCLWSCS